MGLAAFLLYSTVGTALWSALLAGAGYLLEDQYQRVAGALDPLSNAVFGALVLWYLYRVATFGRERGKASR
jgi:membrane protein DedA with SNARE-associated domain